MIALNKEEMPVKVKLISVTPNALDLLLGTKSTRMRGQDVSTMTEEEKREHWKYMLNTIRSPFEFVDYIFQIEGVSKNFTHQFVRTRTGAYQQETSRALDMSANQTVMPDNFESDPELQRLFFDAIADASTSYQMLLEAGAQLQDARSILPSNMETKITAKFNLRTLSDMSSNRLCTRTAGEYQTVFREMRRLVLSEHPWAESLLQPSCIGRGQCAFPRHGKENCVFWRPWMDLEAEKEALRITFWGSEMVQNNPVAANGTSKG